MARFYSDYCDASDLAEKALHYAYQRPEETRRIAENGRRKVVERCDGREFWGKLFEVVGIGGEWPSSTLAT